MMMMIFGRSVNTTIIIMIMIITVVITAIDGVQQSLQLRNHIVGDTVQLLVHPMQPRHLLMLHKTVVVCELVAVVD